MVKKNKINDKDRLGQENIILKNEIYMLQLYLKNVRRSFEGVFISLLVVVWLVILLLLFMFFKGFFF